MSREYVFLYKENNNDFRDCVNYIEIGRLGKLECGHYFPTIGTHGACFSGSLKIEEIDFDNIITILTKEEFKKLDNYNKEINSLKFGITLGDKRYNKGIELFKEIEPILNKLLSEENEELFKEVQEEEKEYLQDEFSLSEDDIEYIFDNYSLDYRDRSIVGRIDEDAYDLGYDYLHEVENIPSYLDNFIDYEAFGEDMISNSSDYLELNDGRIVHLNY